MVITRSAKKKLNSEGIVKPPNPPKPVSLSLLSTRERLSPKSGAPVPAPVLDHLTPIVNGNDSRRSEAKQVERTTRSSGFMATKWDAGATKYRVAGVKLTDLRNRPKNRPADIASAQKVIDGMKAQQADACSGAWYDEDYNLLIAVFAARFPITAKQVNATLLLLL